MKSRPLPQPDFELIERSDGSLLELVDHLLTQGVVLEGDLTLGVANVDLIYLRLSALLCASDRVHPHPPEPGEGSANQARPGSSSATQQNAASGGNPAITTRGDGLLDSLAKNPPLLSFSGRKAARSRKKAPAREPASRAPVRGRRRSAE